MGIIEKSVLIGIAGAVAMFLFYFSVTGAVSGFTFAAEQFFSVWYWIIGLAAGFGIQAGLFALLRFRSAGVSSGTLASSGGASGIAMIACCAHRLVDIVPLVGITFVATALIQYQPYLFALGLVSNIAGIIFLAKKLCLLCLPRVSTP